MKFKTHIGPPPQEDDVPTLCFKLYDNGTGPTLGVFWKRELVDLITLNQEYGQIFRHTIPEDIPLRRTANGRVSVMNSYDW